MLIVKYKVVNKKHKTDTVRAEIPTEIGYLHQNWEKIKAGKSKTIQDLPSNLRISSMTVSHHLNVIEKTSETCHLTCVCHLIYL